jgi:hypothetical protein
VWLFFQLLFLTIFCLQAKLGVLILLTKFMYSAFLYKYCCTVHQELIAFGVANC